MGKHLMGSAAFAALAACGGVPSVNSAGGEPPPRLVSSDLSGLGGQDYTGTLTYRDYGSGEQVTLDVLANVTVKLDCLTVALQYPDEPEANSDSEICISEDGRKLDGAPIISLQRLGPDFVALQTEAPGEDDNRPALIRQSYILSTKAITTGKEVSFDEGESWIERNELDIERSN